MKEYEFNIGDFFQLDGRIKAISIEDAKEQAFDMFINHIEHDVVIEIDIDEVEYEKQWGEV